MKLALLILALLGVVLAQNVQTLPMQVVPAPTVEPTPATLSCIASCGGTDLCKRYCADLVKHPK